MELSQTVKRFYACTTSVWRGTPPLFSKRRTLVLVVVYLLCWVALVRTPHILGIPLLISLLIALALGSLMTAMVLIRIRRLCDVQKPQE
jgi:hypothetical protein